MTSATTSAAKPSTNFLIPKTLSFTIPKLSLGCPILTKTLAGGLPVGTLTEISGEAATGKTQLCLQLLLTALRPTYSGGLASSSLLILPSLLPSSSLLKRLKTLPSPLNPKPLDHVFVASAHSPEHLMMLLYQADSLFENPPDGMMPVRLVVVDSVADIFRSEFENNLTDLKSRTGFFFKLAAKLKEQACRFGSVAVVTNQVVDMMDSERDETNNHQLGPAMWSSGRRVSPAMGLSWSNCINSRIFLSRNNKNNYNDNGTTDRKMEVVFAPHLPKNSCEFVIRKDGVFGLESL
ncbi:hypothetical protein LUZ60_008698 [Juncus effusus]|nr:hypothetical protein LUZ60_008698 [Juncus effusus]